MNVDAESAYRFVAPFHEGLPNSEFIEKAKAWVKQEYGSHWKYDGYDKDGVLVFKCDVSDLSYTETTRARNKMKFTYYYKDCPLVVLHIESSITHDIVPITDDQRTYIENRLAELILNARPRIVPIENCDKIVRE